MTIKRNKITRAAGILGSLLLLTHPGDRTSGQTPEPITGLSITTRTPVQPGKNGTPEQVRGFYQYQTTQVWITNALVQVITYENPDKNLIHCKRFQIAKDVPQSLWQSARDTHRIRLKQDTANSELWSKTSTWETAFEWWTATNFEHRKINQAPDFPLEYASIEAELTRAVDGNGAAASRTYPPRHYVGLRWVPLDAAKDGTQTRPAEPAFQQWLVRHTTQTPPLLYHVVKRSDLPAAIESNPVKWKRYDLRLKPELRVLIEVFELPD